MSFKFNSTTLEVALGAVAVVIIYDIYAAIRWGWAGTISANTLKAAQKTPIIGVAIGIVVGHLFWVNAPSKDKENE